jgi:hypothetical protein
MVDELDPDETRRLLRAWARPASREELHGLGVRVLRTMSSNPYVHVPPEYVDEVRQVVDAALAVQEEVGSQPLADGSLPAEDEDELDLGGEGYLDAEVEAIRELLRERQLTARRLEDRGEMSYRRALRFWHWFDAGAVTWDGERLHAGPGFRWILRKTKSGSRRWTLVRVDSG